MQLPTVENKLSEFDARQRLSAIQIAGVVPLPYLYCSHT